MPRTIQADGRTVVVPDDATDEEINQIFGPAPKATPTPPAKEGFFHSLGSNLGLTGEPPPTDLKHSAIDSLGNAALGPIVPALKGLYGGAKRSGGELIDAGKDALAGNGAGVAYHGVKALPVIGPALDKAADQYADKDTAGELGTLTGATAQIAPLVLGGVDAAAPKRPLLGQIPSTARAGAKFNELNTKLANQPVPLNASLDPLDSMSKFAEAGAELPGPANKLLTRSQATFPLEYPEARRFQETLGKLSRADRDSLNGSQGGNLKQLNQGLYQDILDAATSAGMGSDYESAMKEYGSAARLKNLTKNAGKIGLGLAGLGEGYRLYKGIQGR